MKLPTRERFDLSTLERNTRGTLTMSIAISISTLLLVVLMALLIAGGDDEGVLLKISSLFVSICCVILTIVSMFNRKLYYAPLLMSVIYIFNIVYMLAVYYIWGGDWEFYGEILLVTCQLFLWTCFASTIRSRGSIWLHPYKLSKESKERDTDKNHSLFV